VFINAPQTRLERLKLRSLTAVLHLMQPLARLRGRLRYGLTPWRWQSTRGLVCPWPRTLQLWSEHWQDPLERLQTLEEALQEDGIAGARGGDYDRWDLQVLGAARVLATTEEHGAGKQLVRFRLWPKCSGKGLGLIVVFVGLAAGAAWDQSWSSATLLGLVAMIPACRMVQECAGAMATVQHALQQAGSEGA
jgi:hypothetical protein